MTSFFDFVMDDINGDQVDFATYRGNASLVVNVASR